MPTTNRAKAALLRRHGFTRAPFRLARGTTTYQHPNGPAVIIASGRDDYGWSFRFTPGRQFNVTAAFFFVGNLRAGAVAQVEDLRHEGYALPDPSAPDAFSTDWLDALFVGLVKAIDAQLHPKTMRIDLPSLEE